MTQLGLVLALFLGADAPTATAGFAVSENFTVFAPNQPLADEVLVQAERLRKKISLAWLNKEFPAGVGPSVIRVRLTDKEHIAFTSPKTSAAQNYHHVTIRSTRENVVGTTLAHEITHVVLATEFQGELGRFADEGLASIQDDSERCGQYRHRLIQWIESGTWPNLIGILEQKGVTADEVSFYAAANSVVEFLLEQKDCATFFQFALDGKSQGWEAAAKKHYGFANLAHLESQWHDWVGSQFARRRRSMTTQTASPANVPTRSPTSAIRPAAG